MLLRYQAWVCMLTESKKGSLQDKITLLVRLEIRIMMRLLLFGVTSEQQQQQQPPEPPPETCVRRSFFRVLTS